MQPVIFVNNVASFAMSHRICALVGTQTGDWESYSDAKTTDKSVRHRGLQFGPCQKIFLESQMFTFHIV
jgi:hypothetical protein